MRKIYLRIMSVTTIIVTLFIISISIKVDAPDSIFQANVEALANDESSAGYVICYHESTVKVGKTYYDCGTCEKVYDETGTGKYTKCFK